MKSLIKD